MLRLASKAGRLEAQCQYCWQSNSSLSGMLHIAGILLDKMNIPGGPLCDVPLLQMLIQHAPNLSKRSRIQYKQLQMKDTAL